MSDVVPRRTFEDYLRANGLPTDGKHACPNCGHTCEPFMLVVVSDIDAIPTAIACGECIAVAERSRASQVLHDQTAEAWAVARARRNQLLDKWRWTIMPDSPMSQECRDIFMAELRRLHRMTVDVDNPVDFVWPDFEAIPLSYTSAD